MRRKTTFINALLVLLTLTYALNLIVSTSHLSELYASYDRNAGPVSVGLAAALELSAFLLSITSTALAGLVSKWATGAATFALLLVWFGNAYSMYNSSPDKPLWVTVLLSCFVPVGTFAVGKVLGSLFRVRETLEEQAHEGAALRQAQAEIRQLQSTLSSQIQTAKRDREQAVAAAEERVRAEYLQVVSEAKQMTRAQPPVYTFEELQLSTTVPPEAGGPLGEPEMETPVNTFYGFSRGNRLAEQEVDPAAPDKLEAASGKFKMSSLSVPQREVLRYLKQSRPSSVEEIAENLSRSVEVVSRILVILIEKRTVVEDNGIFQAIV